MIRFLYIQFRSKILSKFNVGPLLLYVNVYCICIYAKYILLCCAMVARLFSFFEHPSHVNALYHYRWKTLLHYSNTSRSTLSLTHWLCVQYQFETLHQKRSLQAKWFSVSVIITTEGYWRVKYKFHLQQFLINIPPIILATNFHFQFQWMLFQIEFIINEIILSILRCFFKLTNNVL